MQGTGPENLVVHNCHNLSNCSPMVPDPIEQRPLQRLLRSLQNPFVKFQSGRPELWIEAAEQTRNWLDDDRNPDFFEELDAEEGSPRDSRDEGEAEEATDDDPSQPGDHGEDDSRDDGGDRFDYDEDEPGDGGCGGHRERVAVVRSKPSAAPRAG